GALLAAPTVYPSWPLGKGRDTPSRLLYTGRVVAPKGLFEAVDAIAVLVERGYKVEFHIVGWSHGRDQTAVQLEQHARQLGVADRLIFDGYRPAGAELLAAVAENDIFLFPTYGEGGVARAIVEAMAVGLPVITTSIRAVEGLLIHRENAYLIPDRSSEAIVEAVSRLIDDAPLRERIARAGHAWSRGFTVERSVELTLKHLRGFIAADGAGVG
ncbi:MAG: glycosyltransferase family 4 protein, partial [Actinomycetota bacterium]